MRVEAKIFEGAAIFLAVVTGIYLVWGLRTTGVEWMGFIGLLFSTLMSFMISSYLRFTFRKSDTRPEDYGDAEIVDGAGVIGFFSNKSFWPILVALGAAGVGIGVALNLIWFTVISAGFILFTVGGLVFEYQIGGDKH